MKGQVSRGHFAGIPHGKTIIDFDNADVAIILGAAAGLAKALGTVALIGGGAAAIIGSLLLGIQDSLTTRSSVSNPKLPIGSAPTWIETSGGRFWGFILDQDLRISIDNRRLVIPYSSIYKIQCRSGGFFTSEDQIYVDLVDGSHYYGFKKHNGSLGNNIFLETTQITVATIGGIQ